MPFYKYQHIERLGNDEVEDIEIGECFVFPKIDGTCSSLWIDNGEIQAGSRNRQLTLDNDNRDFYNKHYKDERFIRFFEKYPEHTLYGEYLVKHSLQTYRGDAWNKFYVFDVTYIDNNKELCYLSYDKYVPILEEFNIDYIPVLCIVKNGSYDSFLKAVEMNTYLIQEGKGVGEGVVIKRYDYKNKYGRTTWAKIVTNEFKEKHRKEMGAPHIKGKDLLEEEIIDEFLTESFIEKTFCKVKETCGGFNSKNIPMFLGVAYHEFVTEEIWGILKKYKNPKIDFKLLNRFLILKIKEIKADLF